jgi:hypothetical protein
MRIWPWSRIAKLERDLKEARDESEYYRSNRDVMGHEWAQVKKRYTWAANELLACDYGDNEAQGEQIGWRVFGWRDRTAERRRRIFGPSIDAAIDAELARRALSERS